MISQDKEETTLRGNILDIVGEIVTLIDSISKDKDYEDIMKGFRICKPIFDDDLIGLSKIEYVEDMIKNYREKFYND